MTSYLIAFIYAFIVYLALAYGNIETLLMCIPVGVAFGVIIWITERKKYGPVH